MKLNNEYLNSFIENLHLEDNIKLSDIPDLDLYMDQVITLFDDKLSNLKRNEDDKILTKTMINNYTKAKILIPPVKKKYSKNHIILLILIYYLKQNLSINDISLLFKDVIKDLSDSENTTLNLKNLYESFLNIKKETSEQFLNNINDKFKLIEKETKNEDDSNTELIRKLLLVLCVINEANTYKRLAENMIDNLFPSNKEK
ncbi:MULTISPECIES: DUF1836 domain-containing protein [Clostridium]|uniref:DUF1836 domain-containing protein n=1 Tax=Clostridium novyi (strain NT) TaxID=386415 RepID=A0Q177_CLONN|nr:MULTISPECIES: DUF1836 domain-containing protein [Clostridium]ABK62080.1 conserved hypothetical protein [Clostridium novyi NT]KEH87439.1 hypothetical protein Z966_11460 [Clostridium novyi A str. NCTC 538]KEH92550.1 hypothetical protein Z963_05265 [Clostridium botulinum C/D str. It1]